MQVVRDKLDGFIKFNQWPLLPRFGRFKREDAEEHAQEQLDPYRERMNVEVQATKPKKVDKKC